MWRPTLAASRDRFKIWVYRAPNVGCWVHEGGIQVHESGALLFTQNVHVATRPWVPPKRAIGCVGKVEVVLEFSRVREGEEGGVVWDSNRNNNTEWRASKHCTLLYPTFLSQLLKPSRFHLEVTFCLRRFPTLTIRFVNNWCWCLSSRMLVCLMLSFSSINLNIWNWPCPFQPSILACMVVLLACWHVSGLLVGVDPRMDTK